MRVSDLVPLLLFLLLAGLFSGLGFYILARPTRAARFFADDDPGRPYTPRDTRVTGLAFAIAGPALFAAGVIRLVYALLG